MNIPDADVLYEDNHLLALWKPAGMLTMGDDTGDVTMVEIAREYLRVKYNKPGNVYVGVVHRLDRPVSGVLLLARTSKAAARLSDQFRRNAIQKTYRAIVEGTPSAAEEELTDWLLKDRDVNVVSVVDQHVSGAQKCVLRYRTIKTQGGTSHLDIQPLTGRSHQIRVQLANQELPIVGDGKYGSTIRKGGKISLHAVSLEFEHPTQKTPVKVVAPIPEDM